MARKATTKTDSTAALGCEAKLWLAAADLRNNMDAAEYKHVVLGLTPRLAIMNLALRGIEADFGKENADTFRNVQHPDLRADTAMRVSAKPRPRSHSAGLLRSERQLLANPPFNDSDWHRKDDDVPWRFGVPPKGNANFAWVQHFIHHLAPSCSQKSQGKAASCYIAA
jgi:type I restriction-modification system DNA methylase subunit